jgi:cytidyltransferase-like protein
MRYSIAMMMKNNKGFIAGAFKPFHKGHFHLIQKASQQCDELHLYVSLKDRDNIKGDKMKQLWLELIEPRLKILLLNLTIHYSDNSPIKDLYVNSAFLDREQYPDILTLFASKEDVDNKFSDQKLIKFCPNLIKNNQLKRVVVERGETNNISGTEMRLFQKENNKKEFLFNLPDIFSLNEKEQIFNLLIN